MTDDNIKKDLQRPQGSRIITDDDGREIRVFDDGTQQDVTTGFFLSGPTDPKHNPVLADPRAMINRRWEKAREQAERALDQAAMDMRKAGPGEGWYQLILHTVKTYYESKNLRGMGEVLTRLGQASGKLGKLEAEPEGSDDSYLRRLIGDLATIAKAINKDGDTDTVIDAQAKDL